MIFPLIKAYFTKRSKDNLQAAPINIHNIFRWCMYKRNSVAFLKYKHASRNYLYQNQTDQISCGSDHVHVETWNMVFVLQSLYTERWFRIRENLFHLSVQLLTCAFNVKDHWKLVTDKGMAADYSISYNTRHLLIS